MEIEKVTFDMLQRARALEDQIADAELRGRMKEAHTTLFYMIEQFMREHEDLKDNYYKIETKCKKLKNVPQEREQKKQEPEQTKTLISYGHKIGNGMRIELTDELENAKQFASQKDAAKFLGTVQSNVSNALRDKRRINGWLVTKLED